MFWQKISHPTEIYNQEIVQQKSRHMCINPEVACITDSAYYTYCSACANSPLLMDVY
jgi:hypothetical protein